MNTEIKDSQIRIIGAKKSPTALRTALIAAAALLVTASAIAVWIVAPTQDLSPKFRKVSAKVVEKTSTDSYLTVNEESINDVPLQIFDFYNASVSIVNEMPNVDDSTIIFSTPAADFRVDNGQIVSEFVVDGRQLASGTAKEGYCAIIGGKLTIGIGRQTPLLDEARERAGSFFRQYPLVKDGAMIENSPKGKSIRRALAIFDGRIVVIASRSRESFYDFAQAIADLGVTTAIYLLGGRAYGWWRDADGTLATFGRQDENQPPNSINYIVWKSK